MIFKIFILSLIFMSSPSFSSEELKKNQMVVGIEAPLLSTNPLRAGDSISQRICSLIFRSLKDLADKIEENGKITTISLKNNEFYHDGQKILPSDVLESIETFLKKGLSTSSMNYIEKVELKADKIKFTLKEIRPSFLVDLNQIKIFREKDGAFLGSGPLQIESEDSFSLTLKNVKRPALKVKFLYVKDELTRFQKFLNGDIDLLPSSLATSKTQHLKNLKLPWVKWLESPGTGVQYLGFNLRQSWLQDPKARLAIVKALDWNLINEKSNFTLGERTTTILNPFLESYEENTDSSLLQKLQYDAKDAAQLVRNMDLSHPLLLLSTPHKENQDLVYIISEGLKKIGFQTQIRVAEHGLFFDLLKKGSFDLVVSRWMGITHADFFFSIFHSSQVGLLNRWHYQNPEMDRLLERRDYARVQKKILEDLPLFPLWRFKQTWIFNARLQNVKLHPTGDYRFLPEIEVFNP